MFSSRLLFSAKRRSILSCSCFNFSISSIWCFSCLILISISELPDGIMVSFCIKGWWIEPHSGHSSPSRNVFLCSSSAEICASRNFFSSRKESVVFNSCREFSFNSVSICPVTCFCCFCLSFVSAISSFWLCSCFALFVFWSFNSSSCSAILFFVCLPDSIIVSRCIKLFFMALSSCFNVSKHVFV